MRTTLTLDDDVAALLQRLRRTTRSSLKRLINDALRESLGRRISAPAPRKPFRTASVSLGRCYLPSLDDVADVLAAAEGERFR